MKFTEAQLENAIIQLLEEQGYPHVLGSELSRGNTEVLIKSDLRAFLSQQYASEGITEHEIDGIIRQLELLSASDLYESNKTFCKWLSDGFLLKREDPNDKDLYIQLIDYSDLAAMRVRPFEGSPVNARAEIGVVARLGECARDWCWVSASGQRGWTRKTALWGVGRDEILE